MLLSLPFLWGGQLAGIFQLPLSIPLLKAAWRISADGQTGFKAIAAIAKQSGSPQALSCALRWAEKRPRVELAAFGGMLAAECGQGDIALDMQARCHQFDADSLGLTELLDVFIAVHVDPSPAAMLNCARRLEARSDLSPTVSGFIHKELLWDAMLNGRLDEARQRAEFVLSIGKEPTANVVLAALARREGNEIAASGYLQHAKLPPDQMLYFQFLAACGAGAETEAREHLNTLRETNASMAELAVRNVNNVGGSQ